MASQGRFAARLAKLPLDQLVDLAAQGCCASEAVRRTADSTLALHDPTPAWAIERILTSPDLVQCIFAHVEMQDHAGARVCKAWKRGWDATDGQRRGLRPAAPLPEPDFDMQVVSELLGLTGERLCLSSYPGRLRIVDSNLQTLRVHELNFTVGGISASEDGLFVSDEYQPKLRRYRLEEDSSLTLQAEYEDTRDEERYERFYFATPAPDGLLFAVGSLADDEDERLVDEIVAFDAATMTVRNRFGRGRFSGMGVLGMAVVGDELYATDPSNSCIRVFSMSGEHLREIRGGWRQPMNLRLVRDRLYLYEADEMDEEPEDETEEEKRDRLEAQRRIFVLTPQGETLQKYVHDKQVQAMAVLGDKLIVKTGAPGDPVQLRSLKGL